jgi:TM2 domain-containing membrane protein YozV
MNEQAVQESPKSRLVLILMAAVMGLIGVHRFYLGRTNAGILTLAIFLGGLAFFWAFPAIVIAWGVLSVWAIYDIVIIARGQMRDADGLLITRW